MAQYKSPNTSGKDSEVHLNLKKEDSFGEQMFTFWTGMTDGLKEELRRPSVSEEVG